MPPKRPDIGRHRTANERGEEIAEGRSAKFGALILRPDLKTWLLL
jgi:hypothetical protein